MLEFRCRVRACPSSGHRITSGGERRDYSKCKLLNFSRSQGTVQTYQLGFSKSDQQSQWIRTEVCLYCRQVTQELTLLLVGAIRRRAYSSARNFLAPSSPECSPQSAPDYTDTGSSAGVQEAVRRWTHEGLFDSLARIRRNELLREYRERYNRQANTIIALVSIPSLL